MLIRDDTKFRSLAERWVVSRGVVLKKKCGNAYKNYTLSVITLLCCSSM